MEVPSDIYAIEHSEMYQAKIRRNERSMMGLRSQSSEYEVFRHMIQSMAYWQTRCAIAERLAYFPDNTGGEHG